MTTIATKRLPWPIRVLLRTYLRHRVRWIETDIAADTALKHALPRRIAEHERVAAHCRVHIATLED